MAKPFKGVVNVDVTPGVLFAHGSRFGGHALYSKDRKLKYACTIVQASVDVSGQPFVDLAQEARMAYARD